jgi:hypothetical protein
MPQNDPDLIDVPCPVCEKAGNEQSILSSDPYVMTSDCECGASYQIQYTNYSQSDIGEQDKYTIRIEVETILCECGGQLEWAGSCRKCNICDLEDL